MSPYVKSAVVAGLLGGAVAAAVEVADTTINDFMDTLLCLVFIGCGALAVRNYTRSEGARASGGEAVAIGGLLAAASLIAMMLAGVGPGQAEILEAVEATGALSGPGEGIARFIISLIHGVILITVTAMGSALGLVGGAIGRLVWKAENADQDQ